VEIDLLDYDSGIAKLRRYYDSHEWWIIPIIDESSMWAVQTIEKGHYMGEANADFQWLVGAGPEGTYGGVVFARKRRMGAKQLARCLRDAGGPRVSPADLATAETAGVSLPRRVSPAATVGVVTTVQRTPTLRPSTAPRRKGWWWSRC
jgi:hypothetical protein